MITHGLPWTVCTSPTSGASSAGSVTRAVLRFVAGSMRTTWLPPSAPGARAIAQTAPAPVLTIGSPPKALGSPPVRISASTARVVGFTRSSTWRSVSATQTEPKPAEMQPRFSRQRDVADHLRVGDVVLLMAPAQAADRDQDGHEQRRQPDRDRRRRRGHAVAQAGQPPAEGAALLLAQRGLAELQLQPRREVLAHGCLPILRRAVASPRLTRLRTTASLVCSSPAISP